jgi:hypothetical protein
MISDTVLNRLRVTPERLLAYIKPKTCMLLADLAATFGYQDDVQLFKQVIRPHLRKPIECMLSFPSDVEFIHLGGICESDHWQPQDGQRGAFFNLKGGRPFKW